MHLINNLSRFLLLLPTLLLNFNSVSALPTTTNDISSIEARNSLHDCSIYVQRWCNDCGSRFDVAYYNFTWSSPWNWPGRAWWNQETEDFNLDGPGDELVPIKVGTNMLHIIDTADPDESNPADAGKLSFKWGTQVWDSFSKGTPCHVQARAGPGAPAAYECVFRCDS